MKSCFGLNSGKMADESRANRRRILDFLGCLLVESMSENIQGERCDSVAMRRVSVDWHRPIGIDLRGIKRKATVSPRLHIVMRRIQRLSENKILHDLLVGRSHDVRISCDRECGGALEAKTRLEHGAVEVMNSAPGRVAMKLANAKQDLARQPVIHELHGGQHTHQGVPVPYRQPALVPGN